MVGAINFSDYPEAAKKSSWSAQFRASIVDLQRRYGKRALVPVFCQVWDKPIYTLSSKHIINDAVLQANLFRIDGELLTRPGPRIARGAAQLCEKIELARQRRK
ncbi:hypothetical protein [Massilia psychrophila]|jgi:hypothetical protein|uniref:Uncharacterized protein n=1 Tax=Massilia psychrophila TaxID=1603353 RepID=A0A2G8T577_9BURK|nr:hypothetical protein [Massilia psychrophila]PIL41162.1 hypothetical protein CR103_03415 [Massilia psychrophila]GGE67024.1 hypothetical protein GCM10008020_09260 [Massilia psychrophila]